MQRDGCVDLQLEVLISAVQLLGQSSFNVNIDFGASLPPCTPYYPACLACSHFLVHTWTVALPFPSESAVPACHAAPVCPAASVCPAAPAYYALSADPAFHACHAASVCPAAPFAPACSLAPALSAAPYVPAAVVSWDRQVLEG